MKRFLFFMLVAFTAINVVKAAQMEADCGDLITITATPKTGYHFVRWSDFNTEAVRQVEATKDTTYRAYFAINQYTITFKNWNDTVLQTGTYNHGDAVIAPIATKTADAQYTYTFDHWTPNVSYTAVADAEYTAVFTSTLNKYTITFQNWDGSVLEAKQWDYGTLPSYEGTPTRPADAQYTYTFSGWDKSINAVTGDEIYTAVYNGSTNSYTLTVSGEHGTTTGSGVYQYGTSVTITATPADCYHFVKWSDNDTNASRSITITGTTNLIATFEINKYTLEVVSDDESQGDVSISK